MNNEEYKPISYVFYIQNPEDFYSQLRDFYKADVEQEEKNNVNDLSVAQEMLQAIGIKTK